MVSVETENGSRCGPSPPSSGVFGPPPPSSGVFGAPTRLGSRGSDSTGVSGSRDSGPTGGSGRVWSSSFGGGGGGGLSGDPDEP